LVPSANCDAEGWCPCDCTGGANGNICKRNGNVENGGIILSCTTGKDGQPCQHGGVATGNGALANCGCDCDEGYAGENCEIACSCQTIKAHFKDRYDTCGCCRL